MTSRFNIRTNGVDDRQSSRTQDLSRACRGEGGARTRIAGAVVLLLLATPAVTWAAGLDWYVRRDHWQDTLQASLAARRQGGGARDLKFSDWSWVGPFAIPDNRELGKVFATRFAPETEPFDLAKPLDGSKRRWVAQPLWEDGVVNRIGKEEFAAYYVTRTITATSARRVKAHLGSDDAITVWLNGKQVLSHLVAHWCAPDQETVDLDLQAGENRLTIKITNGLLDAAFYFSLQPHTATADSLAHLWDQLIRDFPAAAQQIAWVRDDHLYGDQPPSRFYRYDDPQVTLRSGGKTHVDKSLRDSLPVSERPAHVGRWQYTIAGAPGGVARRSDQAGDEASVDFVGDSIALLHKEGRLERTLLLSREAEQLYGLAAVTLDGGPVEPGGPITRDDEGNAVIDTSRGAHVVLARGLTPGRHRVTVTNLGRPSHPGGSTAAAVLGFFAGVL